MPSSKPAHPPSRFALLAGASALLASSLTTPASAQFCDSELVAATPEISAQSGASVTVEGTTAAFGSPFADGGVGAGCANGAGAVSVFELMNGTWTTTATLASPNPECSGQFGYDVTFSNGRLIVGAPFEDAGGVMDAGRAYVFERRPSGWVLTQTLEELSQSVNSRFGHSVDLSGDKLAISALRSGFFGPDSGAVFLYRRQPGVYVFEDRVGPTPLAPGGFFGTSVSVFGDYCAVGAVFDSTIANQEGAVLVFERQANGTWNEYARLTPPVSSPQAFYGIAVDLRGSFLVVGAEGISNGAPDSGSAFVYRNVGGGSMLLEAELSSPTPVVNGIFGRSVSYSSARVVITEVAASGGGAAHTYSRSGSTSAPWEFERTITGINQLTSDAFGVDASLSGDTLVVGANLRTTSLPLTGGAFAFDLVFEDCNANGLNDFCEVSSNPSLDCDGNGLIDTCEIGTGGVDCNGNGILDSCDVTNDPSLDCDGNGLIDTCEIAMTPGLDCNGNGILESCDLANGTVTDLNGNMLADTCEQLGTPTGCQVIPNSTGNVGTLVAIGSELVTDNDVTLIAGDMPQNAFGYTLVSRTAGNVIPPGAVGTLCLGGSVGRYIFDIFNTMSSGTASMQVDLIAIPQPNGPVTTVPGDSWYFQVWHRDAFSGTLVSTFTDSVLITFQ